MVSCDTCPVTHTRVAKDLVWCKGIVVTPWDIDDPRGPCPERTKHESRKVARPAPRHKAAMDMCSEYGLVTLAIDTLREWESTLIDVLEEEDADTILDI